MFTSQLRPSEIQSIIGQALSEGWTTARLAARLEDADMSVLKRPGLVKVVAAALHERIRDLTTVRAMLEEMYEAHVLNRALQVA